MIGVSREAGKTMKVVGEANQQRMNRSRAAILKQAADAVSGGAQRAAQRGAFSRRADSNSLRRPLLALSTAQPPPCRSGRRCLRVQSGRWLRGFAGKISGTSAPITLPPKYPLGWAAPTASSSPPYHRQPVKHSGVCACARVYLLCVCGRASER